jgi:hypothetical protein
MSKRQLVFQFKITLLEIDPRIWRRVQVPTGYSFWDLHVAIQDAMGWVDYHLHAFRFPQSGKQTIEIGIPFEEYDDLITLPGWETPITNYFTAPGDAAVYEYDFGDSWQHELLLEGVLLKEKGARYPRCIGGERACPPEDCGSIPGYYHMLEVLADPVDEEYAEMVTWLKGHVKNYHPYDPDRFDVREVVFDNPRARWRKAFSDH